MDSFIGKRIAQERKRLGLNQDDFAQAGGVKRAAQVNYEGGKRAPDVDYLVKIGDRGADVNFILFGDRKSSNLQFREAKVEYEKNNVKSVRYNKHGTHEETSNKVPTSMIEVEPTELQILAWYRSIKPGDRQIVEAILKRFAENAMKGKSQNEEVG